MSVRLHVHSKDVMLCSISQQVGRLSVQLHVHNNHAMLGSTPYKWVSCLCVACLFDCMCIARASCPMPSLTGKSPKAC